MAEQKQSYVTQSYRDLVREISEQKYRVDHAQALYDARQSGLYEALEEIMLDVKENGLSIGKEQSILGSTRLVALNFLRIGLSPDLVAEGTDLSLAEVKDLNALL
jgi:hypothetical protein